MEAKAQNKPHDGSKGVKIEDSAIVFLNPFTPLITGFYWDPTLNDFAEFFQYRRMHISGSEGMQELLGWKHESQGGKKDAILSIS